MSCMLVSTAVHVTKTVRILGKLPTQMAARMDCCSFQMYGNNHNCRLHVWNFSCRLKTVLNYLYYSVSKVSYLIQPAKAYGDSLLPLSCPLWVFSRFQPQVCCSHLCLAWTEGQMHAQLSWHKANLFQKHTQPRNALAFSTMKIDSRFTLLV